MTELQKAIEFNNQIKGAILTIYNALNQGQQKQVEEDPAAKAVLQRYGIING